MKQLIHCPKPEANSMGRVAKNLFLGSLIRSDTNQAVQSKKMAADFKFQI